MLHSRSRWRVRETDRNAAERLAAKLGIPLFAARLLAVRGFTAADEAEQFLFAAEDQIHDPFLLDGMERAVHRIREAVARREKIWIYGDYDADGVSSTALMIRLFEQLAADFAYYIPHRSGEGYGLNISALETAHRTGVTLIVTVDTGISAVQEAEYARTLGMDVIVTDHHEPPELLPDAYAIINPKKPGDCYPFKALAGVGVALKLAQALVDSVPEAWFELASLGTVADLVPLVGENRAIVKKGIRQMRADCSAGLKALFAVVGIKPAEVGSAQIAYALAPRINAGGRMESALPAVKLLTARDALEAEQFANDLERLNTERRFIAEETVKEARALIEGAGMRKQSVLIVASESWNVGVIGIVAARITETYKKPSIVLSVNSSLGIAKGSARSIAGFDIVKALSACSEWLDHFGGHQSAAGLTIQTGKLALFQAELERLAKEQLAGVEVDSVTDADFICSLDDVTLETLSQIELLEPFGMGNPAPVFVFQDVRIKDMRTLGKDNKHLKLSLFSEQSPETAREALGFGWGKIHDFLSPTTTINVLAELSVNEWNGNRKPQLVVRDLHIEEPQVFDWRGSLSLGLNRIGGLLEAMGRAGEDADDAIPPAVFVADISGFSRLPERLAAECPVWSLGKLNELFPLNKQASSLEPDKIKNVILYSLPDSKQQLERFIRHFSRLSAIYALFVDTGQSAKALAPNRDSLKKVYAVLAQMPRFRLDHPGTVEMISGRTGLSEAMIRISVDIFEELFFLERDGNVLRCVPNPKKRQLDESARFRSSLERAEAEQTFIYSTAAELTEWFIARLDANIHKLKTEEFA